MNTPDHSSPHTDDAHAICPACGTKATRSLARFCRVCGRKLDVHEDYTPTDALRASYRAHHPVRKANTDAKLRHHITRTNRPHTFSHHDNQAAHLALAFVAFALVPYLGILFCPGAFIAGCAGVHRARNHGGRHAAMFGIIAAFIIFAAQIFLWWLLYKIPSWAGI
ncbi:MAG: hypothetical protein MSG64_09475 [Pyrinomonadaceae bacterium MAG19_C2-C3]|nr:hypothetical protein [Pyrinomonadaceae bacterium MAG19_C2-C3]